MTMMFSPPCWKLISRTSPGSVPPKSILSLSPPTTGSPPTVPPAPVETGTPLMVRDCVNDAFSPLVILKIPV